MKQLTVIIHRFDGQKSYIKEYRIPLDRGATLLGCLMEIQRHHDATLNFTPNCRSSICGACAVRVNGSPMLACDTNVGDVLDTFGTDTIVFQPLANLPVISDLVVDWKPSVSKLRLVKRERLQRSPGAENSGCRQTPEEQELIEPLWDCMLCGACASACQKISAGDRGEFLPPFAYTHACRTLMDSRIEPNLDLMRSLMTYGLWRCLHCGLCLTVCPKALKSEDHISYLRALAARAGVYDESGYRHGKAFVRDWEESGRLNEVRMNLRTEGVFGSVKQTPLALRLLARGKLNPLEILGKPKIPRHEDLKRLINSVRAGRDDK